MESYFPNYSTFFLPKPTYPMHHNKLNCKLINKQSIFQLLERQLTTHKSTPVPLFVATPPHTRAQGFSGVSTSIGRIFRTLLPIAAVQNLST